MYIFICLRSIIILSWKGVLSCHHHRYHIASTYCLLALHRDCVASSRLCFPPIIIYIPFFLLLICSVLSSDKHIWIRLLSVYLHIALSFRDTPEPSLSCWPVATSELNVVYSLYLYQVE